MTERCEGPNACDYETDHDEHGAPVNCPHTDCLEHHGDACYDAASLSAQRCASTIALWKKAYRCVVEGQPQHRVHYVPDVAGWQDHRIWVDRRALRARYPRLLAAVQWAIIGTESEAASALEGYRNAHGGSEAVQHYGGPRAAIAGGIRGRHFLRQYHPQYLTRYVSGTQQ